MTAASRPSHPPSLSETGAWLTALTLLLLSALLVIRALEGRSTAAMDLDVVKVIGEENTPMPISHPDAAPVDCESRAATHERCQSPIRRASY